MICTIPLSEDSLWQEATWITTLQQEQNLNHPQHLSIRPIGLAEEALSTRFQLNSFKRGQKAIIESVLKLQDVQAVMPTGGGKSLCYQLPVFCRPGIGLVISPLIALMRDQVAALREKGLAAGCLHSDQSIDQKREVFRLMRESESFLLYLSPERAQKDGFIEWLKNAPLQLIAIDEAHCVSQWGHDFRQDYAKLASLRELRPEIPMIALTATATPAVLTDIRHVLSLKKPDRHIYGFYRPNLYTQVEFCSSDDEKVAYLLEAIGRFPEGKIIIYSGTRKNCEALADEIGEKFSDVAFYHAGLSADRRSEVQDQYIEGKIRILVATNAFGMGIDQPDVRLVAHYQIPASIDAYYQEMGRAGRDGLDSTCLLLYSKKDRGLQSYFIRTSTAPPEVINRRWRALDTITAYAEGGDCRQGEILTYFRDSQKVSRCGHCDICDPGSARRIPEPAKSVTTAAASSTKKKTRLKKKEAIEEIPDLDSSGQIRADQLRQWRLEYSKAKDIPAFVVFSNRSLEDIARRNPQDLEELEAAYGMGPKKIKSLGPDILEVLARCQ